jgi:hypothetical protein
MHRTTTIALIVILIASSTILFQTTSATAEPSVPEFTVKLVDESYDVTPSASTNPYTGEATTTPSYHVKKVSIEITIKNQPFTPSIVNGNTTGLFYNVEAKTNKPHFVDGSDSYNQYATRASSEEYTVVTIKLGSGEGGTWDISSGSQVDIRVQAVVGYSNFVWGAGLLPAGSDFTLLLASGWSSTQTITVGTNAATATPAQSATISPTVNPTATPSQSNTETQVFGWSTAESAIVVLLVVVAVLLVFVVFYLRKRSAK